MKVLVTPQLPDQILEMIRRDHEVETYELGQPMPRSTLMNRIKHKQGLLCSITDWIDNELQEQAPHLRIVSNFAAGHDNIDIEAATKRGILVCNVSQVTADATADLTFALILSIARRIIEIDRHVREGITPFYEPLMGRDVYGKTLGIIGLGEVGKAVAKRARGFTMQVIYSGRLRLPAGVERKLRVEFADKNELLSAADFVSLHVPLTRDTFHLLGRAELELMKPTSFLVNTSRGPVVDEIALLDHLRNRMIAGAALDVYEKEPELTPGLAELDNVVLLSHAGAATVETRWRTAEIAAKNLIIGLGGDIPPNCLNRTALMVGQEC